MDNCFLVFAYFHSHHEAQFLRCPPEDTATAAREAFAEYDKNFPGEAIPLAVVGISADLSTTYEAW